MSVGNAGAVKNLLEGIVATEYVGTRSNQGVALFPEMVYRILTRSDLTEANARVWGPKLFDGTNDEDVESGAVRLIGILVDNTEAAENAICIYSTATVVEGTTDPEFVGAVDASEMQAYVFMEPENYAALSWSAIDGDQTAGGTTLSAANSVKVTRVYVE